jgi:photosystem II stability/assembly factor-like uncharacterized protein
VNALAIDPKTPETVYAGTDTGGAFKSTNGGGLWVAINSGLNNEVNPGLKVWVSTLVIDPATPSILYAGSHANGMFKSTDGGNNWTTFNSGLTDLTILTLVIDPENSPNLFAGTSSGVFDIHQVVGPIPRFFLPLIRQEK